MLYGTTQLFLEHFGLKEIKQLPGIEELARLEMQKQKAATAPAPEPEQKAPAAEAKPEPATPKETEEKHES
jgi:hypothetical protein